ncbi:MAG: hypothetical protein II047_08765, partial [Bacteroidales bacterium]|nr:hypothetical protein [Bacteroidales bacterium]
MTFNTYGDKGNPSLLLIPGLGVSYEIFLPLIDFLKDRFHIVAVPTPVTADHNPDLEPLKSASLILGRNLQPGSVAVFESMETAGKLAAAPLMFRFGMRFAMPGQYSNLDFFGLGPWENYADRSSSALLGRYSQRVEDQY